VFTILTERSLLSELQSEAMASAAKHLAACGQTPQRLPTSSSSSRNVNGQVRTPAGLYRGLCAKTGVVCGCLVMVAVVAGASSEECGEGNATAGRERGAPTRRARKEATAGGGVGQAAAPLAAHAT